ncbi:MAG: CHAD domain-containing protein [Gemmatimonadaceae bacterium]
MPSRGAPSRAQARARAREGAPATVRAVARARLEQVLEKVAPLLVEVDDDPARILAGEEVHDFRVAVRRLRSWLRACEPLLASDVPRPLRNGLRKLARRAGRARDAQVQWQWLSALPVPHTAGAGRAASWFAARRAADFAAEYERLKQLVAARWPALGSALGEALHEHPGPADGPAALTAHLVAIIAHHAATAQRALDRIEHSTQVREIHRARIQVKRLRYVVEAVGAPAPPAPGTRVALRSLRRLQDSLGEVHDAHVLTARVDEFLRQPRRRGTPRPAVRDLRALRAALRRAELAAFRASLDQLAAPQTSGMWTAVGALATRLAAGIA